MRSPQDRTQSSESWRWALAVLLALFGAAMMLVPHQWNVTPLGAIALAAAAYLNRRTAAWAVPLVAVLLSDVFQTVFRPGLGFSADTLWVFVFKYLGIAGLALCGYLIRRPDRLARGSDIAILAGSVAAAGLLGAVVFFVISNFGAWLTFTTFYPRTSAGLLECYVQAIPFFRAMLLGDLIYVPVLFGALSLAERTIPALAPAPARQ